MKESNMVGPSLHFLVTLMQRLQEKPAALLSASAIGYYGHQDDAPLSENAEVVPGFVLRLLVGEMAEELLLNGQRVVPTALQKAGFEFQYPQLEAALENIL
jgi:NAD dependent epimerase/dehydratase family enzyme